MNTMKKLTTMILALLLALCLGVSAFAEEAETPAADVPAAETPAAADTAVTDTQADTNALNDALTAYRAAKAESRKQARLDKIKQELDGYVAAGSMTQEQADLILKYYTEQMTQTGNGSGRGGKGMKGGQGMLPNSRNGQFGCGGCSGQNGRGGQFGQGTQPNGFGQFGQGTQPNGFGQGGRHGRFSNVPSTSDSTTGATPTQPSNPGQTTFPTPERPSGF